MHILKMDEMNRLQQERRELFRKDVLHILNGQAMYEEFEDGKLLGDSDYVPFNEAMCVHTTTNFVFDQKFIETRAFGHHDSVENYRKKVIEPLDNLINKQYEGIVLWFGEDMFCQMNVLTLLAYLEQSGYDRNVYLNSFQEDVFKVSQTELTLGNYSSVYEDVLINHHKPSIVLLPIMDRAIDLYLDMLKEENAVVQYISDHKELPESVLINRLFIRFPDLGYGDVQYRELINKIK
ncbi:AraC family transcriptional regulator [Chungangia koreensis]|uniref:AraC family transcriptional regulator n=1 Tax=Chungangia koreensis TaxID=752657 RepID=A0ABV8X729_9LACT